MSGLIVITRSPNSCRSFLITISKPSLRYPIANRHAGTSPQEAAAMAVNEAIRGRCKVLAPPDVMCFVPDRFHARNRSY